MRTPNLRKYADIDVLDIRARYPDRHHVFGFAGCGAGVTANTARVVDDFRPLHGIGALCLLLDHFAEKAPEIYHGQEALEHRQGFITMKSHCLQPVYGKTQTPQVLCKNR